MFGFLKKLFRLRFLRRKQPGGEAGGALDDTLREETWTADFSAPRHTRFEITSEISHDGYIRTDYSGGALVLALKKRPCIAWIAAPQYRYGDQVIEGRIRLEGLGGYAAAGLMFRMVDDRTAYMVLISNKGYFRLDVLRNGSPLALIAWTEVPPPPPDAAEGVIPLTVVAYGTHLLLRIHGQWAAEIQDATIPAGRLCFVAAAYEGGPAYERGPASEGGSGGPPAPRRGGGGAAPPFTARAFLEALSVESRIGEVAALYEQYADEAGIDPQRRFRLAETFAAMGQSKAALVQLRNAERSRHDFTRKELLLAGRLALELDLPDEAEEYLDRCAALSLDRETAVEKAKLLYIRRRFEALEEYGKEALRSFPEEPGLWALLGHGFFNQARYEEAAAAYDRAFALDGGQGLLARNAANAYELAGRKGEALDRYLRGGRVFLAQGNDGELALIVKRLRSLGEEHWEARALTGKWAFGLEDWKTAEEEFSRAEELRQAQESVPRADGAVAFLRGLLRLREGKREAALPLLEEAASLEPNYGLFRFRLAETRFLLHGDGREPALLADLEAALALSPEDGWVHNLAAQIALSRGEAEEASASLAEASVSLTEAGAHLEKAAALLGDVPAIRVNRAELYYRQGFPDKALELLTVDPEEDGEGMMTNYGGNLLFRAGRYEEAAEYYRKALAIAEDNAEYRCNLASALIEAGSYGEADAVLSRPERPTAEILELISFVAIKKGEYPRAEAACRAALDLEGAHIPSLLSLGWIYASAGRWDELREILALLEDAAVAGEAAARRDELARRMEEALFRHIPCDSCGREWRVPRAPPPAAPLRIFAMPPDELPAGTCPGCGKTYCIGCGKQHLDEDGRFLCPHCGKTLKLTDEGLKGLLAGWASGALP
ncbi:MAG: tetratricopeptide repeat protein [Spirochaetaceae bacterium]|jgi:tetratricopeptide (TPR) repeat protein|nr:tetratricopeptide repeat protein [Spirochaetaceae bacterium]